MEIADTRHLCGRVLDEIERAVVGRRSSLEQVLIAVLGRGHVLLEDLPGLGKTLIARSFAQALGLTFTRVQFTPDLLPTDLTGASLYDPRTSEFVFHPGPVFTQLLLADEINRTPPKTQAALLEAMQERQVSVDGTTMLLPRPFVVLATDNPVEYEGTYPLPEAQLDRFAVRLSLGYLSGGDEQEMLRQRVWRTQEDVELRAVISSDELGAMQDSVERVHVDLDLLAYVQQVVQSTREHHQVLVGASPRGGLALVQLARSRAAMNGRDYVVTEDIKTLAVPVLAHRITVRPEMWVRRITGNDIVNEVVATVPTPTIEPAGT